MLSDYISHNDKMSKFYQVSKVLNKRTDTNGRVQYHVRWRGYGKKYDSWVDKADINEHLKNVQAAPSRITWFAVYFSDISTKILRSSSS